jgi:hypothetical protein
MNDPTNVWGVKLRKINKAREQAKKTNTCGTT